MNLPKQRRIRSGELFSLADAISKLSGEATHVSQSASVATNLNSALVHVLDAAKSVAFQEARDAHILSTREVPAENGSEAGK